MPRVLLREVYAGGVKGGRGQRDRGPGTQGPWKGSKGERGRASRQGAGQGQGAGAERGGKEGALPRELLRIILALAGGQRNRDGRAGQRACHGGMKERTWQKQKGAPQPSESPAVRGGTRRGGAPQRAATRQYTPTGAVSCVASCNEGQVRACDMCATCLHSVLRSVLRGVEREKGRGGRGRQGGRRRTMAAGGCSATCVPQAQGPGRQGAAR